MLKSTSAQSSILVVSWRGVALNILTPFVILSMLNKLSCCLTQLTLLQSEYHCLDVSKLLWWWLNASYSVTEWPMFCGERKQSWLTKSLEHRTHQGLRGIGTKACSRGRFINRLWNGFKVTMNTLGWAGLLLVKWTFAYDKSCKMNSRMNDVIITLSSLAGSFVVIVIFLAISHSSLTSTSSMYIHWYNLYSFI